MASTIPLIREVDLQAPPSAVWPLVSNTERLNRALGLPEMVRGPAAEDYSRAVTMTLYGLIPLKWKERPFEFIEGKYYHFQRDFEGGPLARVEGGMELIPGAGGKTTRLRIRYEFTPRNALGAFLARYVTGRQAIEDAAAVARDIAAAFARGDHDCFPGKRTKTPNDALALAARGAALRKASCDQGGVERLLAHVEAAHDDELTEMRPFELADLWAADRVATLRSFLHAVKAGVLDLSWHVLCPNCSGGGGVMSLAELKGTAHCKSCNIEYGLDLGESVELRFSASQGVRRAGGAVYCVGSPAHTPFAAAQVSVPAEGRELELDLASESYALRDLCGKRSLKLRPSASGPSRVEVDYAKGELAFKPGRVTLSLPGLCESALVRVERESWKEKSAKASLVTALQDFRDLFGSDVLTPGVEISVRSVALLFSDLKSSTALYEQIGDAQAYAIVRDHFDYLFEIVARRRGAVVKTIGDAVMACFATAADACEAALEMQERIGELNKRLAPRPGVALKLGVHQGPAIAINTSGALDYFGTTVNVAARVQNESTGGDLVCTEAVCVDPGAAKVLESCQWDCSLFEIHLKGLSETFRLRRLTRRTK